jgi:serine/threonine protein kinase
MEEVITSKLRPSPEIPEEISFYKRIERVKVAGSTRCYRAQHEDGTEAMLKLIETPETVADFDAKREAKLREYYVLRRLDSIDRSARCERYFRFDKEYEGRYRFVVVATDPVPGLSLRADRQKAEPSLDRIVRVFEDAFKALGEVHRCDIQHRTLSPDCIYLDENNRVRFTDFVFARLKNKPTISPYLNDLVADDPFRAPEFGINQDWVGNHTDVFGLTASLHFWITGQEGGALQRKLDVGMRDDICGAARSALSELLGRCTAEDGGKRPTVETVLAEVAALRADTSSPEKIPDLGKSQSSAPSPRRVQLPSRLLGEVGSSSTPTK